MPDLFDNFFGKMMSRWNGGKTTPRYGGATQVNSGRYYSYHQNGTNNKYWLPIEMNRADHDHVMPPKNMNSIRKGSVASMLLENAPSRHSGSE
ncbi:hypothetical protein METBISCDRAFT_17969 [Metschnikowia bicuspidata]|uniref:Uncharacterized protein n=1 Tax=Metschnikowia bicuspidata TaxID=27322 RepID=A0A4V1J2T7_9ASCO|nr:hypothetical protein METBISCDRAFT_17969 [Metschnikowia bicuspidata]